MRRPFVPLMLMVMFAATLAACAAPTPGSDAIAPQAAAQPAQEDAAPAAATPAAPVRNAPEPISSETVPPAQRPPRNKPAPPMSDPLPAQRMPEPAKPGKVDSSCKSDADCTVKDVGNCCGYYPACVNVNSPTDPRGVQAQCAKSGMASVCGFQEIRGCQCVRGQCQASSGAVSQ